MGWDTIRDQSQVVRLLHAHLRRARVAPAYLLAGPDGVGKRRVALEFSKAVNCDRGGHPPTGGSPKGVPSAQREAERHDGEPCDECRSCSQVERGVHPDVHQLIVQGAAQMISIDAVRALLGRIALRPYMGRRSVVIVDGAERLTEEAANSLLKALEEPPGQTTFLLLTVNPARCLPTIVSRCQTVRFSRLSTQTLAELLVRRHQIVPEVAREASAVAQGSGSRALELAQQWERRQRIRAQVAEACQGRPACAGPGGAAGRQPAPTPPNERQELAEWCEETIHWLRDAAVASATHPSQAQPVDVDRCIATALECVQWTESLQEQFVSPRLVATLLRESWHELRRR